MTSNSHRTTENVQLAALVSQPYIRCQTYGLNEWRGTLPSCENNAMSTAVPNIFVSDSGVISLHKSWSILHLLTWPRGKFILLRKLCFFAKDNCECLE